MGNTPKKKLKLDSDIKLKLEWEATAQQGGPPPEDADKYKPLNNESTTESNNKSQNSENNQSYDSESNGQDTEPNQKSEPTSEQKKEISDKEQAENDQINKDLANGKQNPNELNNELNKDENNPNQQNQTDNQVDNQQNNNQNNQNSQNNQNNNQNNSNNNQNNNQPNNQQNNTENKNSDNKSSENKTEDKSKNDNKQRTQDKRERNKEQIEKSAKNKGKKNGSPKPTSPDKFKNAKGFKGKANYLANKARNKAKGTEMFQRIKKAFQTVQKVIQVLQTLWKPIAIVSLIVVLLFNGTIFIISISKSIGTTPHYYCDINPDDPITKTFLYQQYCSTKKSVSLDLEELNGHYIFQTGSGPCTTAALANVLLRYYAKNDVDIMSYLWNKDTGYSDKEVMVNGVSQSFCKAVSVRGSCGDWNKSHYDSSITQILQRMGKSSGAKPTLGYLQNEEVYEEYESHPKHDDYSYSADMGDPSDTNYNPNWGDGVYYEIDGVKATIRSQSVSNIEEVKTLLEEHPSGVVLYFNYPKTGDQYGAHGVTVTKYEDGNFYCIDPCIFFTGTAGFEVAATSESSDVTLWNKTVSILQGANGGGFSLDSCYYIEEDTN